MRLFSISNGEYLSIMEYDEIDKTGDDEISGVDWLDSICLLYTSDAADE